MKRLQLMNFKNWSVTQNHDYLTKIFKNPIPVICLNKKGEIVLIKDLLDEKINTPSSNLRYNPFSKTLSNNYDFDIENVVFILGDSVLLTGNQNVSLFDPVSEETLKTLRSSISEGLLSTFQDFLNKKHVGKIISFADKTNIKVLYSGLFVKFLKCWLKFSIFIGLKISHRR